MDHGEGLSERKKSILKAIIDLHIEHGEPIGSKFLMENRDIRASSATIRNEMAELEEKGYLEQPHTSAGRVPSERGYRFYVDSLMRQYQLTRRELEELDRMRNAKVRELDRMMEQAGRLIAALTDYPSLMVRPRPDAAAVRRFRLIRCDTHLLILVMMLTETDVRTRSVRVNAVAEEAAVALVEQILNRYLGGVPAEDITLARIRRMEQDAGAAAPYIEPLARTVYDTLEEAGAGDIRLEGVDRLLGWSDYADRAELRGLMDLSESKERIMDTVAHSRPDAVNVYIGRENPVEIMKNSTMIFRTISHGGRVVGAIGVIGPCRMAYNKVISTIDHLSRNIADMIGNEETEDEEDAGRAEP